MAGGATPARPVTPELRRTCLLLLGTAAGYALLMAANPVRASLRDGLRCLRRYRQIWLLPVFCNVAHAVYNLGLRWYGTLVTPGSPPLFRALDSWQPPAWREVLAQSLLPAFEGGAAPFNCLVTTFPLSALAALLLLVNWRDCHGITGRALRRRLGVVPGLLVQVGLIVSGLAAVGKPMFFGGGLLRLNTYYETTLLLRTGEIINGLGFIFEYLLGVALQIYLILLCYSWVRGLTFDYPALRRFALRRFAFVVRWALVMVALSTIGINLPLVAGTFPSRWNTIEGAVVGAVIWFSRWLLAIVPLLFCSMQITLVFHNETLRKAFARHIRFLRRHAERTAWLAMVAGTHFLILVGVNSFLLGALGERSWPAAVWSVLLYPLLWSTLAAWLLASWVCLFRRCELGRPEAEELVAY